MNAILSSDQIHRSVSLKREGNFQCIDEKGSSFERKNWEEEERKEQEKKEAKELCKSVFKKEIELSERHEKEENTWKREKDDKSWKDQKERDARLFGYDGPLIHHRGIMGIVRAAKVRDGDDVDIGFGHRDGLGFSFGQRKKYLKYN
jgi:hypothetical protein